MTPLSNVVAVLLLATLSGACAAKGSGQPVPATPSSASPELAAPATRVAELEAKIEVLEGNAEALETKVEGLQRAQGSWSCMAKCGSQSTQTTARRIEYERVTGQGSTAAAAYEEMSSRCNDGTLYERLEDGSFVGGDMKSVCIPDAANGSSER